MKFTLHWEEASGYYTTSIPKPVIDHLGKGKGVDEITYLVRGSRVEVKDLLRSMGFKKEDSLFFIAWIAFTPFDYLYYLKPYTTDLTVVVIAVAIQAVVVWMMFKFAIQLHRQYEASRAV